MSLTLAIMIHATAVVTDFSKSLASRRLRLIQARVLSTTQRRGSNTKPLAMSDRLTIDLVKRSELAQSFVLLPRRWVVGRTLAWINRNRRLAKDFEKSVTTAVAWIMIASVKLITRRLTRA